MGALLSCLFPEPKVSIEDLDQRLQKFDEENKRLQESVDTLHAENDRLKGIADQFEAQTQQLTEEVTKFTEENTKLSENVSTFQEQNNKLKDLSDQLHEENDKFSQELKSMRSTLQGLETVKQTLETYAKENMQDLGNVINSLNETLDEQRNCVKKQSALLKQAKAVTSSQEKILLMQLQSQCQFMDGQMDMSHQEFEMFVHMIPAKFRNTPVGLEFDSIDADKDGKISMREFHDLVDKLVATIPE